MTPVLSGLTGCPDSPSLLDFLQHPLTSCSQLHSKNMCCRGSRSLWGVVQPFSGSHWGSGGSGSFRIWKHLGHQLSSSGALWYQATCPGAQQTHNPLVHVRGQRNSLLKRNKVWPPGGTESRCWVLQGLRNHTGACDARGGPEQLRLQSLAVVCGSQPAEARLGVWLLGLSQGRRIFACSWVHALADNVELDSSWEGARVQNFFLGVLVWN